MSLDNESLKDKIDNPHLLPKGKIELRRLSLRIKQLFSNELRNAYYISDINGKEELIGYFRVLITKDDCIEEIEIAKVVRVPLRIKRLIIAKHKKR